MPDSFSRVIVPIIFRERSMKDNGITSYEIIPPLVDDGLSTI